MVSLLGLWTVLQTVGCGNQADTQQEEGGRPPASEGDPGSGIQPPQGGAGSGASDLEWAAPAGWVEEQPSSQMRKAQYRVPGPEGDAEVVVFYFGPGQGGDAMSNAQRWASQFTKPDGSSSLDEMQTHETEVNGKKVLHVEVAGTYTNTMVSNESHPNHRLLGAIVEGPDANWFFKMTGPSSTVESARADFDRMIQGVQ